MSCIVSQKNLNMQSCNLLSKESENTIQTLPFSSQHTDRGGVQGMVKEQGWGENNHNDFNNHNYNNNINLETKGVASNWQR